MGTSVYMPLSFCGPSRSIRSETDPNSARELALVGTPLNHVLAVDRYLRAYGNQRVHAFVVLRAVQIHPHRLTVEREGVAISAGVHACQEQPAAGFTDVSQAPIDQRQFGLIERLNKVAAI